MQSSKKDKFLKEVLSYVKFPFDRDNIRAEFKSHIEDKIEYYIEEGYDDKTAEELSINDMGDAKEIGRELNKQHNPLIGWVWVITNVVVVLFALSIICNIILMVTGSMYSDNTISSIPRSDIIYKVHVDKKVKLDDGVFHFKQVAYTKDGIMNIFYNYYFSKPWIGGWGSGDIGEVKDNLGNVYSPGSGASDGGIIIKNVKKYSDFSKEADMLIIDYDQYNRKYRVEIPLKVGDKNE